MVLAADYPLLDVFWTMLIFFLWIAWFWILFTVIADIFRRHDISGLGKTAWIIFTILLPFLGVFVYLIVNNDGMMQRNLEHAQRQQAQFEAHVRDVAGGSASEIAKAKQLLDSGAITQEEYEALKARALATA
jgi:type VI protein secretion system component VasK